MIKRKLILSQQEMPVDQPAALPIWAKEKKRGGALTAWLVGMSVWVIGFKGLAFLELLRIYSELSNARFYENVMPSVIFSVAVNAVLIIALVTGLTGMWKWNRWGAYFVAGALATDVVAKILLAGLETTIILPLIALILMYVTVSQRWHLFK
jgi:hypothetical protein